MLAVYNDNAGSVSAGEADVGPHIDFEIKGTEKDARSWAGRMGQEDDLFKTFSGL